MRRFAAVFCAFVTLAPAPAAAGEAAALTRRQIEADGAVISAADAGSFIEAGARLLKERVAAAPADNEAQFGLGMLRFARAVERYGQAQYRYGLRPPRNLAPPFLRFPVPLNPAPEELTYEKQRETLQSFLDDLKAAEAELAKVTPADVKIVLDLNKARFDLTGSGRPGEAARLGEIMAGLRMVPSSDAVKTEPFEVAFDNADALWLQGYCNLLSGMLEFFLAYDWHVTFEDTAGAFYPKVSPAPLNGARTSVEAAARDFFGERNQIADAIALLHDISWPLTDAARMQRAHAHLKKVVTLGRATWKAILAETDDDREWIPGPQQKNGVIKALPVGQEQVDGWLATLDVFDQVLDGKILVPHWRFSGGINLRRVFLEPRRFDAVLWATGHGAAPYVETGEIMGQRQWDQWGRVFGGNFLGYAVWFN